MREKTLFNIDIPLLLSVIALMIIGILFIYSSGVSSEGVVFSREYVKQIIWCATGIGLLLAFSYIDYNKLRDYSAYIFLVCILLLVITFLFGERVNGAKSWLGIGPMGVQPSEFTKIATILFLASYIEKNKAGIKGLRMILTTLGILIVPIALILIQPDMGTALVYIPIYFFILYFAGARMRYLVFLFSSGIFLILFGILPAFESKIFTGDIPAVLLLTDRSYFMYLLTAVTAVCIISTVGYLVFKKVHYYWISYVFLILLISLAGSAVFRRVLREYQITRFIVFLDPSIDPQGAGWNVIQSVTAVGSGGLTGKGFLQGTQSHYRFLPQQSTDFIFSIIAEEWGFLGSMLVLSLFLFILIRALSIVNKTKDTFATLVGAGITGMIFFHVLVNIGMAMGIMPITGIPLFFLSYGGSSLWTAALGLGIIQNIHSRRFIY